MSNLAGLIRSRVMVAIVGAVSFLGTMAVQMSKAISTAKLESADQEAREYKPSSTGGSWELPNSEMEQIIEQLRFERNAVRDRSQQLNELEVRLKTDRVELDNLIVNVKQLQEEFDRSILRVQEEEAANLKRLAKVYASMEPASAVAILKELDDYSLVKILLYFKDADTAPILETLSKLGAAEAKRAAGISESLRTAVPAKLGATQPGPTTLAKAPQASPPKPASPASTTPPAATQAPPPPKAGSQ